MESFLILWALPVVHDLFLISFISLTNLVIYLLTILSTQFGALEVQEVCLTHPWAPSPYSLNKCLLNE